MEIISIIILNEFFALRWPNEHRVCVCLRDPWTKDNYTQRTEMRNSLSQMPNCIVFHKSIDDLYDFDDAPPPRSIFNFVGQTKWRYTNVCLLRPLQKCLNLLYMDLDASTKCIPKCAHKLNPTRIFNCLEFIIIIAGIQIICAFLHWKGGDDWKFAPINPFSNQNYTFSRSPSVRTIRAFILIRIHVDASHQSVRMHAPARRIRDRWVKILFVNRKFVAYETRIKLCVDFLSCGCAACSLPLTHSPHRTWYILHIRARHCIASVPIYTRIRGIV